jgi:hypothetical protein
MRTSRILLTITSALTVLLYTQSILADLEPGTEIPPVDWAEVATEVQDCRLGADELGGYVALEELQFSKGLYWFASPEECRLKLLPFYLDDRFAGELPLDLVYDVIQRGDIPLTRELAQLIGVKRNALPDWKELTRTERLQLFASFPAPERNMPLPMAHPPFALTLPGAMAAQELGAVDGLGGFLAVAFADPESTVRFDADHRMYSGGRWLPRFTKRYLRLIANQQTGGFFEPWHENFSPGNGYFIRIDRPEAIDALVDYCAVADRDLLLRRIAVHPPSRAIKEPMGGTAGTMLWLRSVDPVKVVRDALETGQLQEYVSFYYFRMYGSERVIAEGIVLAPTEQALTTAAESSVRG